MSIYQVLNTAKTALWANEAALNTTSNNIANVNTPGYTRQRAALITADPVLLGFHVIGTGVKVSGIERIYDKFLDMQILGARQESGRYNGMSSALSRLEGIFNEANGLGLSDSMNEFFNAMDDVANDPASYPARSALLSKAATLTDRINFLDSRTRSAIGNIEAEIKGSVDEANTLIKNVARLNGRIHELETQGNNANDLRDQRDEALRGLSEFIDISVIEDEAGQMNVLTSSGSSLVLRTDYTELSVGNNPANKNYYDIKLGAVNITDSINSGRLRGLVDSRDGMYSNTVESLDRLSASLMKEFNARHLTGFGLDGSTGLNFFTALSPAVVAGSNNAGKAAGSSSVYDNSLLMLDNYEIRFTDSSKFNIINTTDNTVVSYNNTYTSGANIDFEGVRVVISDQSGVPEAGDVFRIGVTDNASKNIGMSFTDPYKFAAASSATTIPGDNTNVLAMAGLRDANVLSNGTATFSAFYTAMVSDIGAATSSSMMTGNAQEAVVKELAAYRESISGVSMEDEAVNLIKYQRAYEAAAKIVSVVDDLLDTVISMR
ncbi:MAG: flagellar hook-associated protein FlgK [Deltaproteobacteria bacterium]|nr:flagellar hook-associated protein FlgK [Deltaproteobacteria bacterium]